MKIPFYGLFEQPLLFQITSSPSLSFPCFWANIWQPTEKQVRCGLQKDNVLTGTSRMAQEITLWKGFLNHIWILNFPSQQTPPPDPCMPNKIAVIAWIKNEITEEFIWEYLSLATHKNALSSLPLIPTCWSKDKITSVLVFSGLEEKVGTSRVLRTQQNHKKVVQILIKLWV